MVVHLVSVASSTPPGFLCCCAHLLPPGWFTSAPKVLLWLLDNQSGALLPHSLPGWKLVDFTLYFYSKGQVEPPEPPVMSQRLQDIAHMSQLYAQHGELQRGSNGRLAAAAAGRSGIHNIMVLACTYKCSKASPDHVAGPALYCSPHLWGVLLTHFVGLSERLYVKLGAGKKRLGNQCSTSNSSTSTTMPSSSSRFSGVDTHSANSSSNRGGNRTSTNTGSSSRTRRGRISSSSSTSGIDEDACSSGKARKGSSKGPKALSASSFAELECPPDHEAVVVVGGRRVVEAQLDAFKEF